MTGNYNRYEIQSMVRVEQVTMRGNGALILTGPSSCGKGEVAAALCRVMSIAPESHLSMGEILRTTVNRAKDNKVYAQLLADKYLISKESNIFDCVDTTEHLSRKVLSYLPRLEDYFGKKGMDKFTSQLEWLEYCTMNGLLVPDRWTQDFIAAHIEHTPGLSENTFILDGYPRTVTAAKHLLNFLKAMKIPVKKVLHLSISKQEMIARARARGRDDDDEASLLSRYQFYTESVQPSVDYLKIELGADTIALIDAHQPVYELIDNQRKLKLEESINNVVASSLRSLGVPRIIIRDLLEKHMRMKAEAKLNKTL